MDVKVTSLFSGTKDRFNGITVSSSKEPCQNEEEVDIRVQASLTVWKENGIRGVWFKVSLHDAYWIPVLIKYGFTYHHAKSEYAMLIKWLPKEENCSLPGYPHNYVGVAGFVVNDHKEVLLIKEKIAPVQHWKLPGGLSEPGESLSETAIREVYEETGVKTEFLSILCFWHRHGYTFGCSDFYFVCLLHALTSEICEDKQEIADSKWMKIDDYASSPETLSPNKYFCQCYFQMMQDGQHLALYPEVITSIRNLEFPIYSIKPIIMQNSDKKSTL